MSNKTLDHKGRWRCHTVAFRVSPEEREKIRTRAKLSGITLQEYIIRRCLGKDIVVVANPRVYKALKIQMQEILVKLENIVKADETSEELLETIEYIASILEGMHTFYNAETKEDNYE
jgi:uncharacterized protein (DUF1778 family)